MSQSLAKSMGETVQNLRYRVYDAVSAGYEYLFEEGDYGKGWGDVRSTALVGLCLRVRESRNSTWLANIARRLTSNQQLASADYGSWNAEIWDTSMAVLALLSLLPIRPAGELPSVGDRRNVARAPRNLGSPVSVDETTEAILGGLSYILGKHNRTGRENWHDDPWETCWSLLSLAEAPVAFLREHKSRVVGAIDWLLTLQDRTGENRGRVVAPQYTAYLVKIIDALVKADGLLSPEELNKYRLAQANALEYLMGPLAFSESLLWSGEPWSNGQILWALSSSGLLPISGPSDPRIRTIAMWFLRHQQPEGNWSDTEDTASALLGLTAFLERWEEWTYSGMPESRKLSIDPRHLLVTNLGRHLTTPFLHPEHRFLEKLDDGSRTLRFSPAAVRFIQGLVIGILALLVVTLTTWALGLIHF